MIPQAFTTRDMSEAYKWLQSLPPTIREEMKSMEQVVSLYLRAKRFGGSVPTTDELNQAPKFHTETEAPKSSQDFQKALKGLKHELEQFDFAPSPQPPQAQAPANTQTSNESAEPPLPPQSTPNILSSLRLDPKSRQIVNEVRESLNLSSDMEVIRMSLVLAHKKLKDLSS